MNTLGTENEYGYFLMKRVVLLSFSVLTYNYNI